MTYPVFPEGVNDANSIWYATGCDFNRLYAGYVDFLYPGGECDVAGEEIRRAPERAWFCNY